MKKPIIAGVFAVLIMLQIAIPVSMIAKREVTLKYGAAFKFKTAPVDPYDAFRGRYVALSMEQGKAPALPGLVMQYGEKVYAVLSVDETGFAKVTGVTRTKPDDIPGGAFLEARVAYTKEDGYVYLDWPMDRYYMEESAAPRAEALYWQHSTSKQRDAQVVVRVLDGFAVIEGLYIDGRRIEAVLKEKAK
ncbi:MAG: GDYXXLXY domain-containing protein [Candidatus Omnitrophota bacterium]